VALANLDILAREQLPERVRDDVGPRLQARLADMAAHPAVAETRGAGLIGAIELRRPQQGPHASAPANTLGLIAHELAREEGVIVRGIRDLVALAPPLVITHEEIEHLFAAVTRALDRLWARG
jgi:adenosylmethionine-8-amino-7-oxononanoate aminotransferase